MWASVRSVLTVGGSICESVIRRLGMKVVKMSKEKRDWGQTRTLFSTSELCSWHLFQ